MKNPASPPSAQRWTLAKVETGDHAGRAVALRTPLYDTHAAAGASFVEFAGFDMPVHYGSIKDEHAHVRTHAGLFDVSHMSNVFVTGPHAAATIGAVTPKDPAGLEIGKGHYSVLLRDDGTILDDTFVFRLEEERFLVIPNAGMNEAARAHLASHGDADVHDESRDWAILALQGPEARGILQEASTDTPPKFHRIVEMDLGAPCLVSGTGYTGEKGVEIYVRAEHAKTVWDRLVEVGGERLRPIGLGARDTLRLEKGYCLAGNEFAGGRTPLEAGIEFCIDWQHDFLGKAALEAQRAAGHARLWGLTQEKGIPRHGYRVLKGDAPIGEVTSGTQSPTLGHGIALAYLEGVAAGDIVDVEVRNRVQPATVVKPPFC